MSDPSATSAASSTAPPVILVATRKGAWLVHGDAARSRWRLDGPHFLGHIINHLVLDPRDPDLRFRIVDEQDRLRPHVRVFVNGHAVHDLAHPLAETDEIALVQALSGG